MAAQKGAPKGNRHAAHDKPWTNALQRAVAASDGKKLRAIAERVLAEAEAGNMMAVREMADRLDGKPVQAIVAEHTGDVTIIHRLEG